MHSQAVEQSDPWAMTPDQRAYYLAQFFRLQPDPSGRLSGQAAKSFFELSKLPVNVLSQIWELSDVDTDGQLNLSEFSVAMHLVVLHRNGVMLPTQLPESLLLVATSSTLSAPPPPPPPPLPLQPSPPTPNASV
ncbi:RalBP1-associated Eps domain-containing protein [Echinococcus granulosus]|uniref:RalBP1-associated Eps domain-containing protein n=1 Tax=Echinococcus granulosus TaxID=6210 RepID=W6UGC8_ECHGR|nr:RalBP1-associated Eps domain-containing protein [Echinococcus granulosus]EUB60026.1 RalBP1-associated Eps domain-containing protein [Echinococcus granulosus]